MWSVKAALLCCLCLHISQCQRTWTKCVPDADSDSVFVRTLDVSPQPIHLPGEFNITFDADINIQVPNLLIDVQIGVANKSTGVIDLAYPQQDQYLRVFEGCLAINKLLFNPFSRIENDLDIRIDQLYAAVLGYHAGCPMLAGKIQITELPIKLPYDLVRFNALPKGQYVMGIHFRSGSMIGEVGVGCYEANIDYNGHIIN